MTPTEMHIDSLMEKIEILESKLAKAKEALEFYANENSWSDKGEKASEALKEIGE